MIVIFGSYFGFVKDAEVAPTDPQLLVILALILGASAFIGLVIAMVVFPATTPPPAQQSQLMTRRDILVVVVMVIGLVLVLWLLSLLS